MYIAQQLKEKNIAEYLLYMWQVEDILRAHHLDPDELKQNYLAQFRATEETEKEMEEWYSHLIRMMKEEGIQEGGHLQINRNIILWLTDLHNQLLQSSKFPFYTAAYYKALPYIVELRNKGDKKDVSELENCFDARDVAPPATQTDKRRDRQGRGRHHQTFGHAVRLLQAGQGRRIEI